MFPLLYNISKKIINVIGSLWKGLGYTFTKKFKGIRVTRCVAHLFQIIREPGNLLSELENDRNWLAGDVFLVENAFVS